MQRVDPRFAVLVQFSVSLRRLAFPACGLHPKQYEKREGGGQLGQCGRAPQDRVPGPCRISSMLPVRVQWPPDTLP